MSLALVRELGPTITAIVVAGRNASGIASELGSMIVTEQVDAMRALGTDPIRKLVTPRVVATVLVLPLLVAVADFVGLIGGFVVAHFTLRLGAVQFWTRAIDALDAGRHRSGYGEAVVICLRHCDDWMSPGTARKGRNARRGTRNDLGRCALFRDRYCSGCISLPHLAVRVPRLSLDHSLQATGAYVTILAFGKAAF